MGIEAQGNRYLGFIFLLMTMLILLSLCYSIIYKNEESESFTFYHQGETEQEKSTNLKLLTFLILYNNLVPVSLYITMDLVRAVQAVCMERDVNFTCSLKDGSKVSAIVRTSNLNDDLGQVDYVFSDKTGTLTENEMIFRVCSAGNEIFGKKAFLFSENEKLEKSKR